MAEEAQIAARSDTGMCSEDDRLPEEFLQQLRDVEQAYLSTDDPIRQSGFLAGPERWRRERSIILEAVEDDGDFLDVGCANGYLLECLLEWARERGIALTPFGVDQGAGLIELARRRLPQFADHFWVANAWHWRPPRKFRYVYTLHDCVPEELFGNYVDRLLARYVEPGGRLVVGAYGSYSQNLPARDLARELADAGYGVAGSASCGDLPATTIAWLKVPAQGTPG
jgi:SAM-dependent methyltransferase